MELWIRSQDKEDLIKTENIRCWNEKQIAVNVWTSYNNVNYVVVGEYETKERALEILNYIQSELADADNTDRLIFVMPKE